jgi:hypothetical protein
MTDVDALCAGYLAQLDAAQRFRSIPQRQQIVEQVTEHLNEARAELTGQSEVAVRSILERLGRPDDIAAAAATGDNAGPPPSLPWFRQGKGISVLAGVFALVALGLTLGIIASRGSTPPRAGIGHTHTTTAPSTNAIETVTVPLVLNQTVPAATVTLQAAGLTVQGIEGNPNGLVISQDPSGGSRVSLGSAITLHAQAASSSSSASPAS